jgi:hypothetical protein
MVAVMVPLISGTTCTQTSATMEMRGQGTDVVMTVKLRLDGRAQGEAPKDPMCALRYVEMRGGSIKILGIAMMEMPKMAMAAVKSAELNLP